MINDRINHRDDDPELVALLACGPGLSGLDAERLRLAALELGPERPIAAVEFVEVAWRAGRLPDAVAIIEALLTVTPDQPAYALQQAFFDMYAATVRMEAAATIADGAWAGHAQAATEAVAVLSREPTPDTSRVLSRAWKATLVLRRLIMNQAMISAASPTEQLRSRADEFTRLARHSAPASPRWRPRPGPTCGRWQRFARWWRICTVPKLPRSTPILDQVKAHADAARRRAELVTSELEQAFGVDDPLAGPLLDLAQAMANHSRRQPSHSTADPVAGTAGCPFLPWPAHDAQRARDRGLPPRRTARAEHEKSNQSRWRWPHSTDSSITGPAVLRHGRVYELSVRVQAGEWPAWVTHLDVELLTHLTRRQVTTPTFSWGRGDHSGDGETYEQSGSVVLNYQVSAGTPAPPMLLRLTWRGVVDGQPQLQAIDVSGHRELRLRPYDATRDKATDYPVFDERLLGLYDSLARAGYDEDQLQAFCRLLTRVAGRDCG